MESPSSVTSAAAPPPPLPTVIPVPIIDHDIYHYIAIKGSLHSKDSSIFGLNKNEILALTNRYSNSSTEILNGILIKTPPIDIINALAELGYKVITSTGETEIIWTMQREM